jgi:hypothetical protein
MLDDVMRADNQDIVSWQPHGKAFRVHKPREFAMHIMPRHFKQTHYKSFQRQLHIYGFHRIAGKGMRDDGAYYHKMFIHGEKQLSLRMVREKIKGPDAYITYGLPGPNFYAQQQEAQHNVMTAASKSSTVGTSLSEGSAVAMEEAEELFFAGKRFFCVEPVEETPKSIPLRSVWTARGA